MPVDHQLERQLAEANAVGVRVGTRPRSCRQRGARAIDCPRVRAAVACGTAAPERRPELPALVVRELDRVGEAIRPE